MKIAKYNRSGVTTNIKINEKHTQTQVCLAHPQVPPLADKETLYLARTKEHLIDYRHDDVPATTVRIQSEM